MISNIIRKKDGYTLVELAIVLVIIGLIITGVLKGQTLIENAKYKRFRKQIDEYATAVYTYYDKYGAYPGDDPRASIRFTGAPNGDGDALIEGLTCTNSSTEESCFLWRHLKFSGIIGGDPQDTNTNTMVPRHVYGGRIDIFSGDVNGIQTQIIIATDNVPGEVALRIDEEIDDGTANNGSMVCTNCGGAATYPLDQPVDLRIRY